MKLLVENHSFELFYAPLRKVRIKLPELGGIDTIMVGRLKKILFRLYWKMMSRRARVTVLSAKKMELQELRLRQLDLGHLH